MGVFTRTIQVFVVITAFIYYRSGRELGIFLVKPDLPPSYSAYGNANSACKVVHDKASHSLKFCEDAVLWDVSDMQGSQDRYLLAGCDPGRRNWNTVMGPLRDPNPRGAVWLYDYSQKDASPMRITLEGFPAKADFHPLGMEVTQMGPGQASRLFVINHGRFNSTIEVFELPSPEKLKGEMLKSSVQAVWVRTLTSKAFVAPNAIAIISPTSFYVTNDHRFSRRLPWPLGVTAPIMESVLQLPLGWVDRVDLNEDMDAFTVTRVASGIPFANGIAMSPNGKHVAVASSSKIAIYYYERDPKTNALAFRTSVPTPACPDNLSYGDDGVLFAAGHPSFLALIKVAKGNFRTVSPSWAWAVIPKELQASHDTFDQADSEAAVSSTTRAPMVDTHSIKSIYQSDGSVYSSSSTIVVDQKGKQFLIVGLYADGILQCAMEN